MVEHDSARRIQRWYREQKLRKQYEDNVAAKELRQQGNYLLQKVSSVSSMHKLGICCKMQCSPYLPGACLDIQAVVAWNATRLQMSTVYLQHQHLLPPDLSLLARERLRDPGEER